MPTVLQQKRPDFSLTTFSAKLFPTQKSSTNRYHLRVECVCSVSANLKLISATYFLQTDTLKRYLDEIIKNILLTFQNNQIYASNKTCSK